MIFNPQIIKHFNSIVKVICIDSWYRRLVIFWCLNLFISLLIWVIA